MSDIQQNQLLRSQSCIPGRKLPAVPNVVPNLNSKKTNNKIKNNLKQQILLQEYSILQEYLLVAKAKLNGLYVIPSSESSLEWFCVLFVKTGHYKGGVFQFTLSLPPSFPSDHPPVIRFEVPIYHPCIHPQSHLFEISHSFKPWINSVHRMWQVLAGVKKSFNIIETDHPFNTQAALDYKLDILSFKRKVEKSMEECNVGVCGGIREDEVEKENASGNTPHLSDLHQFSFRVLDAEVFEKVKKEVMQECKN